MSLYWDSSALVAACQDSNVRGIFQRARRVTRSHTFAEIFSTLTGGRLGFRVDADEVAGIIEELSENLIIQDLKSSQVKCALAEARSKGVRGGRVHDFLHATAAVQAKCDHVVTYNLSDFEGLYDGLEVIEPEDLHD